MAVLSRSLMDKDTRRIRDALKAYETDHPKARIAILRRNSSALSIRVTDASFKEMDPGMRHDFIWRFLEPLPVDLLNQIYQLILETPAEARKSVASFEFDQSLTTEL